MEKTNAEGRCVYTTPIGLCPGTAPLHPKEHYLPAGLGNFEGDIRLRDFICYDCQKRFAQLEEVFLRNSTEAFFRRILGVQGRKNHVKKNIFVEPTLGLPPLTVKAMHPSMQQEFLWEMKSDAEAFLMHQLVFRKADGQLVHVPIRSGRIQKDLEAQSSLWPEWQLVACIAGDGDEEELQKVVGGSLNGMSDAPLGVEEGQQIEGQMHASISLPYVRAIAKIAFHYVLATFHFTGFEPEFDDLKRFIYHGIGEPPARIVDDVIMPEIVPEDARLKHWSHILTAEFNRDGFFARMHFFAGPRLKPFTWRVVLGKNPSRILPEQAMGWRYTYYDEPSKSGYVGKAAALQLGPKIMAKL
jgi:hypothetical protein